MTAPDHQNSTGLKPPAEEEGPSKTTPLTPHLESTLRCPRCDSPNTKFCYYNNYSLSQPRHFCKSCRRYWTRGGALRNVPVGGSTRKNKRIIKTVSPSPSSSDCLFGNPMENYIYGNGFKFLHEVSINRGLNNNPSPNGVIFENASGLITHPETSHMGSVSDYTNLASSIENLSFWNQNLHWKLQEQRLALFLGHDNPKEMMANNTSPVMENILFDSSLRKECAVGAADQWSFGNSTFASSSSSTTMAAAATSGRDTENGEGNIGILHGVQAWNDLQHHHYNNNY